MQMTLIPDKMSLNQNKDLKWQDGRAPVGDVPLHRITHDSITLQWPKWL